MNNTELIIDSAFLLYRINFRKIRFFCKILDIYGYSAEIETERWKRKNGSSVYVNIFDNNGFVFALRFSDHNLKESNYLPAGVINDDFTDINSCLSDFEYYLKVYERMSEHERKTLMTNRLVADLY